MFFLLDQKVRRLHRGRASLQRGLSLFCDAAGNGFQALWRGWKNVLRLWYH